MAKAMTNIKTKLRDLFSKKQIGKSEVTLNDNPAQSCAQPLIPDVETETKVDTLKPQARLEELSPINEFVKELKRGCITKVLDIYNILIPKGSTNSIYKFSIIQLFWDVIHLRPAINAQELLVSIDHALDATHEQLINPSSSNASILSDIGSIEFPAIKNYLDVNIAGGAYLADLTYDENENKQNRPFHSFKDPSSLNSMIYKEACFYKAMNDYLKYHDGGCNNFQRPYQIYDSLFCDILTMEKNDNSQNSTAIKESQASASAAPTLEIFTQIASNPSLLNLESDVISHSGFQADVGNAEEKKVIKQKAFKGFSKFYNEKSQIPFINFALEGEEDINLIPTYLDNNIIDPSVKQLMLISLQKEWMKSLYLPDDLLYMGNILLAQRECVKCLLGLFVMLIKYDNPDPNFDTTSLHKLTADIKNFIPNHTYDLQNLYVSFIQLQQRIDTIMIELEEAILNDETPEFFAAIISKVPEFDEYSKPYLLLDSKIPTDSQCYFEEEQESSVEVNVETIKRYEVCMIKLLSMYIKLIVPKFIIGNGFALTKLEKVVSFYRDLTNITLKELQENDSIFEEINGFFDEYYPDAGDPHIKVDASAEYHIDDIEPGAAAEQLQTSAANAETPQGEVDVGLLG